MVFKLTSFDIAKTGLVFGVLVSLLVGGVALSKTTLSHGYQANEKIALGSIVSLAENKNDEVVASTSSQADAIFGVVINDADSLLSLSSGQDNQVQVATSGVAPVLVSDINGSIERGDHITASPIKGVGMKATVNTKTIGIAQGDPTTVGAGKETYKDSAGHEEEINLAQVSVLINAAYYFKEPEKTIIPATIQNVANSFAGKQVSPTPILISAGIFLITLVVVATMIYSMIRNSIISVGRNPMAQSAVFRDVLQLSALILAILSVAVISIYLILTRF